MTDMIVEIMVEILTILAIATKEVKRGRFSELMLHGFTISKLTPRLEKYFKKLIVNSDMEDSLKRLDKLTQEEARMASAEQLKMTHGVDDRVKDVEGKVQDVRSDVHGVGNKVQGVGGMVQDVRSDVHDVGNKVQGVEGKVQDVDDRVQGIGNDVRGIDDKLNQVNCSLSL